MESIYAEQAKKSKLWKYESPEEYINDSDLVLENKHIDDLNEIDEFYTKHMKETKFDNIEKDN